MYIVQVYFVSSSVSWIREDKRCRPGGVLVDLVGTIKFEAKVTMRGAWWCLQRS